MSKVVRLPEILANFFRQYPTVINELVSQIEDGALNLNIDVTALQSVTNNQAYDIDSKIDNAIAPLLARLEAVEATVTAKKLLLSLLRQKVLAA